MKYLGQFSNDNDIVKKSDISLLENNTIKEISTQYIRITDLETGVYKLTYNGTKYIYYWGTSGTSTHAVTGGSGAVVLIVNKYINTSSNYNYWHWYYINGQNSYESIYFGFTDSSLGQYKSKILSQIITTSEIKNNLTYSTSDTSYALSAYQGYVLDQNKEDKTNKVTSLSSTSTDDQYPSAKCVYDLVGDIETLLSQI